MQRFILTLIGIISIGRLIAQDATIIYNNAVKSTVTIETDVGLGSGFFIDSDVIATNYHVIKGATYAFCYPDNSTTLYKITGYVAIDQSVDLVLLKVEGLTRSALRLSKNTIQTGEKIYVIGSPKGLPATISDGIVSGLRDIEGNKLIQITAPVSHGSSGGPVLNDSGDVIGVTVSQISQGQNLNFAIPISYLQVLINFKQQDVTTFKNNKAQSIDVNENGALTRKTGCIEGDCKDGTGTYTYANGNRYEGEFKNYMLNGTGTFTFASGTWEGSKYTGEWKNNLMSGTGIFYYASGDKYEGQFEKNNLNGIGTYTYKNGDVYTGEWSDNKCSGKGTFTYADGEYKGCVYEGEWKNSKMDGQGVFTCENGKKYTGHLKDNMKDGKGVLIFPDGSIYEGLFSENKFNGEGCYTYTSGKKVCGKWKNNELQK